MVDYTIQEAIARNATLSHIEPGPDGQPVIVKTTCSDIIKAAIIADKEVRAKRKGLTKEVASSDEMIVTYMAVNWANIYPE